MGDAFLIGQGKAGGASTADKIKLTQDTAALYGLTGDDANVDVALSTSVFDRYNVGDTVQSFNKPGNDWLLCDGEQLDFDLFPELSEKIFRMSFRASEFVVPDVNVSTYYNYHALYNGVITSNATNAIVYSLDGKVFSTISIPHNGIAYAVFYKNKWYFIYQGTDKYVKVEVSSSDDITSARTLLRSDNYNQTVVRPFATDDFLGFFAGNNLILYDGSDWGTHNVGSVGGITFCYPVKNIVIFTQTSKLVLFVLRINSVSDKLFASLGVELFCEDAVVGKDNNIYIIARGSNPVVYKMDESSLTVWDVVCEIRLLPLNVAQGCFVENNYALFFLYQNISYTPANYRIIIVEIQSCKISIINPLDQLFSPTQFILARWLLYNPVRKELFLYFSTNTTTWDGLCVYKEGVPSLNTFPQTWLKSK